MQIAVPGSVWNVRFGSEADICSAKGHVRFTPESGHVQCTSSCPLCANSGLMQRSKGSLFDQLVGDRKQIRWDIKAERFGGCEVDDEIDLACQLNRHIGGCRPFENPASVDAGTTIGIGLARSVAHKDAGLGVAAKGSARRQRVAKRQRGELSTSAEEIWSAADEQPARALLDHRRKSGMEFALVGNFQQSGLAGQSFDQPSPPPPYGGRLPARPDETARRWRLTWEPSRAAAPAAWRPNQKR